MFIPNPNQVSETASRLIARCGIDDAAWWANEHSYSEHCSHNQNGADFWRAVYELICLRGNRAGYYTCEACGKAHRNEFSRTCADCDSERESGELELND
jgi:hypothetical protein